MMAHLPERPMTSHEFFKLAERIEDLARSLYLVLADHSATPPGVRQLLLGLADEEEEHARRIQLLSASLRGSTWTSQLVDEAAAGMRSAAVEFERFLASARNRRVPGDLMKILDRLVEMEARLAFVHAEDLAQGAAPAVARLFEALARQDQRHRKLLERARQAPGSSAARA
jgi:rubrerythrin